MAKSLSRKLQTWLVWWWLTHRPWPIRRRILQLAPCAPNRAGKTLLVVLASPAAALDAAWAARSFLTLSGIDLRLCLLIDAPEIPRLVGAMAQRLFPGCEVCSSHDAIKYFSAVAPRLAAFASGHPLGRKLASILHLQTTTDLIYCDSDVLCFRALPELRDAVDAGTVPRYLQDVGSLHGDAELLERAAELGLRPAGNLNSGLLFVPKLTMDIPLADRLLESPPSSWFAEQTIIALLMGKQGALPLPASSYVVSMQAQFYPERDTITGDAAARHFVTPVRHLMYRSGMPILMRTWRALAKERSTRSSESFNLA